MDGRTRERGKPGKAMATLAVTAIALLTLLNFGGFASAEDERSVSLRAEVQSTPQASADPD
jgi:hypothetical protein